VVLGALAQALPGRIPAASQGTMNNLTVGGNVDGQQFVYYETIAGGHGAAPDGVGMSGRHSHMTNTLNTPVEALEAVLPLRVLAYELRAESGGLGQQRGGDGIRRTYEFLTNATVTLNTERRRRTPFGLNGGTAGRVGQNTSKKGDIVESLGAKAVLHALPGDVLTIETPGGGGWGTPPPESNA
ncbi:MAG: hydantoinase B/oxoprolinase family protein, partial [Armatimonadetes bacterium]|nr:hydantoinase B/oxoprolinase family protein [Anaerolineae bacterium]